MRDIHLAALDRVRPVLVLTAPERLPLLTNVTVVPITSTIRGWLSEVAVGTANGLDHESVASCDNIQTIPKGDLGPFLGTFFDHQEPTLARALALAFDLDVDI